MTMSTPLRFFLAALLFIVTTPGTLRAHSVWLEPLPDGQIALRFGEWGDEPETSPGHLDSLINPTAMTLRAGEPVPFGMIKKADHYLLAGSNAAEPANARSDYSVMKHGDKPGRRPFFHARWWPSSRPVAEFPVTVLDLLPSSSKPGHILVMFKGKPVPAGTALKFHSLDPAEATLTTDESGHVRLPEVKKPGLCLLTLARYSDPAPGEYQGKAYEIASHSATLCWKAGPPPGEAK